MLCLRTQRESMRCKHLFGRRMPTRTWNRGSRRSNASVWTTSLASASVTRITSCRRSWGSTTAIVRTKASAIGRLIRRIIHLCVSRMPGPIPTGLFADPILGACSNTTIVGPHESLLAFFFIFQRSRRTAFMANRCCCANLFYLLECCSAID